MLYIDDTLLLVNDIELCFETKHHCLFILTLRILMKPLCNSIQIVWEIISGTLGSSFKQV